MLPTLIFGGTAQDSGDTTILNDQAAITENMNEIAFAVSDLLGSGIADAEQRIADDFAASSADQYEIINPYEDERINNVNLFISQYCAYRDTDVAAISLEDRSSAKTIADASTTIKMAKNIEISLLIISSNLNFKPNCW